MATNYPQQTITTFLGLSLIGMDEVIAEDMIIIDNAFGSGGLGVTLQTNSVNNTLQNLLNLKAGANITLTADGAGGVTIASSGGAGGVTSFSGDGVVLNNSGSTGVVTATLATHTANTVFAGPTSGGAATPTFRALVAADLPAGTGTVTSFSAGNIGTIATTSVATPTTTPALTFSLATQSANTVWAGPTTGAAAAPTFRSLVAADLPSLSTLAVTSFSGDGNIITNSASQGAVTVTIAGTSGGIPYFSSTSAWTTSALLASGGIVLGGGSGTAPLTNTQLTFSAPTLTVGLAGTSRGILALTGSTSGSVTITAPATAGTSTNPITISNSLQLPSGTVYNWNGDTGLSRDSGGVIDVGNGTAGDVTGSLKLATITAVAASTQGSVFSGTAPGSSSGAGTAAGTLLTVTSPAGGATTGSATTGGTGGDLAITTGAGGSGAGGTNASGGRGGNLTITMGAGGAKQGTGVAGASGIFSIVGGTGNVYSFDGLNFNGPSGSTMILQAGSGQNLNIRAGSGGNVSIAQGQLSIQTTKWNMDTTGKNTIYASINTVGQGIPAEYATVDLTAQSAAISATTVYTPTVTGWFRISVYLKVTTPASASSSLGGTTGVTITYTDGTDSVAQSVVVGLTSQTGTFVIVNAGNSTTTVLYGDIAVYAKTGVAIQYAIDYSSTGTTAMQYAARMRCEAM